MTALEYMGMEAKEGFFEKTDLIGVTFFFSPYFEDGSILSTDNGKTRGKQGDTSCSVSKRE